MSSPQRPDHSSTPDRRPGRPRQVTTAVVVSVAAGLLLVVSLFDTMARLRSTATRAAVEEFLVTAPGRDLGLEVDQVLTALRGLAMAAGALAAVAVVSAVFVMQRHRGARLAFTVAAALLVLTVPVAGLLPAFLALSAVLLWSRPAREWYDGSLARLVPAPAAATAVGPLFTHEHPAAQPDQPGGHPPVPPPPPVSGDQPSGPRPPGWQQPPQPDPVWGQPPAAQPWQQPSGWQPPPPYAGYPAYGLPATGAPRDPDKRPGTVTVAAVLTWLGAGATALMMVLLMLVLAAGGDTFVEEFNSAASGTEVNLTADEVLAVGWGIAGLFLFWSLVAVVLAVLAFRRSNAGRIALAVSAGMTALFSLVAILSGISVLTLLLGIAVLVLLFTGGANDWYARRTPAGPPPPDYGPPSGPW